MKINIFSFTRDRLDYTMACFDSLHRCKKYIKFDHYVIDNGSIDNTKKYLSKTSGRYKGLVINPFNQGLHMSSSIISQIMEPCDLVIKVDNDCFFADCTVIKHIAALYKFFVDHKLRYIVSPKVEGIVNQPKRGNIEILKINNILYQIGHAGQIGGLCLVMPYVLFSRLQFNTNLPLARGLDSSICGQSTNFGYKLAYMENISVMHYETTNGQAKRYPEYFVRKKIEEVKLVL